MREAGNLYSRTNGRIFAFAVAGILVLAVFLYGFSAQAQTPADDQYGSPTAVGVAEGSGTGATEGSEVGEGAVGSSSTDSEGEVSNDAGDPQGVLDSVLPSTGGSLGSLVGLVALALVGTGVLVFRSRSARS